MIGDKNDSAQRFWFRRWSGEEHDRTGGLSDKAPGDIAKKSMQHDLFFQRAGNDHVDFIFNQDPQDRVGRIALFVMDGRIARELQLRKRVAEFLRGFLTAFTHINHMKIGNKPIPDSLCFREYLLETL